jgi:hypothetical protein
LVELIRNGWFDCRADLKGIYGWGRKGAGRSFYYRRDLKWVV